MLKLFFTLAAFLGHLSTAQIDLNVTILTDAQAEKEWQPSAYLSVSYSSALQPLVVISVGGQSLNLVFDASSANALVFVKEFDACTPVSLEPCYSYKAAQDRGSLHVCAENNDPNVVCDTSPDQNYLCNKFLQSLENATAHQDALIIDGLTYFQQSVEVIDDVSIDIAGSSGRSLGFSSVPVRLVVKPMVVNEKHRISLNLFEGTDGILGASGATLSCRNTTFWNLVLKNEQISRISLDMRPPINATIQDPGPSRIIFNEIDPTIAPKLVWSQAKQTGDMINDGMHEFLLYHPEACGVDLLYNASSNWLVVIDTSGPCLSLPPFLFDRLITQIPVTCPFPFGSKSQGQLCSPNRAKDPQNLLPSFSFQLEDTQEPMPTKIILPLERLVFRNATGVELLCVARQDSDTESIPPDMMYSHIAIGSMAVSALYTVIDLETHKIGLASRGNISESSEVGCVKPVTCLPMQTFFPPLNLCEDPQCGDYMFMMLDETTKTCVWKTAVPASFGLLLIALVVLDLTSHRLYKQAIQRASEFSQ